MGMGERHCGLCPISLWCIPGAVTLEKCCACTQVLGIVPGGDSGSRIKSGVGVIVEPMKEVVRLSLEEVYDETRFLVATQRCDAMNKYEPIVLMSEIPRECWNKFKKVPARYTYCQRCCARRAKREYHGNIPECVKCSYGGRVPLGHTHVRPY